MKKLYTFSILLTAICGIANAQSPNWLWVESAGGISSEYGVSICTDASGNVYMAGYFGSSSITFGTTTLTNAGNADILIVKYDASGNVLWAKSTGGTSYDFGYSVSTDTNGNVYMTGSFRNPSLTFGTTTLTNADNTGNTEDIFIVKYDASGNVLWAKSEGGTSDDFGKSVSTDASGNVYMTGYFKSSITFGTTTLSSAGNADIFIVKYDASGNVLWAKSAGGTTDDVGNSCSTDASGNVYITGYFISSSITFGTTTLTNAGGYDIFIVKYDASGNVNWAKSAGGLSYEYGMSVSTDANGNVYMTGYFRNPSLTFGTTTLTNADNTGSTDDIFIVKYDASGNVNWAKSEGGTSYDVGISVSTNASGNVYITGAFISSSITFGSYTLTNAGGYDIFIVKYDASGNVLYAKSEGGTSNDWGNSVSTDASVNVFVTGFFSSSSITFGTTTLMTTGFYDVFIAKLDGTTGINEWSNEESFSISPNPFSTQTVLQADLPDGRQAIFHNATLTVHNCFGQTVKQIKNISGQTVTFSRDNLPNGLYFIRLTEENKTIAADKPACRSGRLVITD